LPAAERLRLVGLLMICRSRRSRANSLNVTIGCRCVVSRLIYWMGRMRKRGFHVRGANRTKSASGNGDVNDDYRL
jgi:hypothetical protein